MEELTDADIKRVLGAAFIALGGTLPTAIRQQFISELRAYVAMGQSAEGPTAAWTMLTGVIEALERLPARSPTQPH